MDERYGREPKSAARGIKKRHLVQYNKVLLLKEEDYFALIKDTHIHTHRETETETETERKAVFASEENGDKKAKSSSKSTTTNI